MVGNRIFRSYLNPDRNLGPLAQLGLLQSWTRKGESGRHQEATVPIIPMPPLLFTGFICSLFPSVALLTPVELGSRFHVRTLFRPHCMHLSKYCSTYNLFLCACDQPVESRCQRVHSSSTLALFFAFLQDPFLPLSYEGLMALSYFFGRCFWMRSI
jgi:hypothetical protein